MIETALTFLKDRLNSYLNSAIIPGELTKEVVYVGGKTIEPHTFEENSVTILLVNLEEESVMRQPDLYKRATANGESQRVQPEIRLNLYLLFLANYSDYKEALKSLSQVIQFFQSHRLFDSTSAPDLPFALGQLVLELTALPFTQLNEVWSVLHATYRPSVLYKLKMVVFQDAAPQTPPIIDEIVIEISQ